MKNKTKRNLKKIGKKAARIIFYPLVKWDEAIYKESVKRMEREEAMAEMAAYLESLEEPKNEE